MLAANVGAPDSVTAPTELLIHWSLHAYTTAHSDVRNGAATDRTRPHAKPRPLHVTPVVGGAGGTVHLVPSVPVAVSTGSVRLPSVTDIQEKEMIHLCNAQQSEALPLLCAM